MQWLFVISAVLLAIGAGYWVYRADVKRAVPYPWITATLRGIVVLLTLLLLVMPAITITKNEIQKPIILFLQDDSRSVAQALQGDTSLYRQNAASLLNKLSEQYRVVRWGFGGKTTPDSLYSYRQNTTDISAALQSAIEYYGEQNLGAIIVASDGHYNQGNNPLYENTAIHCPVFTVALGDSTIQKDIRILKTYANKRVSLNSEFELRADIAAVKCRNTTTKVLLQEQGDGDKGTTNLNIQSDRYDQSVSFTLKALKAGLHHYIISTPVLYGESNTVNNRRDVFVEVVDEKKNILIITAAPHPDVYAIKDALSSLEGYSVTVKTTDNLPASFSEYQVVVVHGVTNIAPAALQALTDAKRPVWYILNQQSNIAAINGLQKTAVVKMSGGGVKESLPMLNTAFSLFTLPQNMESVADKMPPLLEPADSIFAMPDAVVLFNNKNSSTQALWMLKPGGVPTAMLAGEGLWRWRLYEYKNFGTHAVIDECIRQTISFLSTSYNEKPFRVEVLKYVWSDQEAITLNAYLLNANNELINKPDAQLVLTDSAGNKHNFSWERNGNAYRLNIGIWAGGTYAYTAHVTENGKEYTATGSIAVEQVPLELMEYGADYTLMYGLAKKYSGAFFERKQIGSVYDTILHHAAIKPVIQTHTETLPPIDWKWYFFVILAVAVGEWLLRKYWLAQ